MSLNLAKQNFKFSAGHFLIFNQTQAEKLHGHNYKVQVDIGLPEAADFKEQGYFVDFNVFKKLIKARLDLWDEVVLLPKNHPDMKISQQGTSLEVNFRDRKYVFPVGEVILLPVTNTSVEQLSKLLAEEFMNEFSQFKITSLSVYVEETIGQGATTKIQSLVVD